MEASTLRFVVSTVLMRFVGNEQISILGLNMSGGAQRPALCHQEFNVAQIYIYIKKQLLKLVTRPSLNSFEKVCLHLFH